jgi:hypothetical protein
MRLTFNGSFWGQALSTNYSEVAATLRASISLATLIPEPLITIDRLSVGSLIAEFTLRRNRSTLLPDTVINETLVTFGFEDLQVLYAETTNSTETISLLTLLFTANPPVIEPRSPCALRCIIAVASAVVSISVLTVIVLATYWRRRRQRRSERIQSLSFRDWRLDEAARDDDPSSSATTPAPSPRTRWSACEPFDSDRCEGEGGSVFPREQHEPDHEEYEEVVGAWHSFESRERKLSDGCTHQYDQSDDCVCIDVSAAPIATPPSSADDVAAQHEPFYAKCDGPGA